MSAPEKTYLFIDGGYLRKAYENTTKAVFPDAQLDYLQLRNATGASKAFYYDCVDDLRQEAESESDFSVRVKEQEKYFSSMSRLSGYHVRRGSLAGYGKRRRQKKLMYLSP